MFLYFLFSFAILQGQPTLLPILNQKRGIRVANPQFSRAHGLIRTRLRIKTESGRNPAGEIVIGRNNFLLSSQILMRQI